MLLLCWCGLIRAVARIELPSIRQFRTGGRDGVRPIDVRESSTTLRKGRPPDPIQRHFGVELGFSRASCNLPLLVLQVPANVDRPDPVWIGAARHGVRRFDVRNERRDRESHSRCSSSIGRRSMHAPAVPFAGLVKCGQKRLRRTDRPKDVTAVGPPIDHVRARSGYWTRSRRATAKTNADVAPRARARTS